MSVDGRWCSLLAIAGFWLNVSHGQGRLRSLANSTRWRFPNILVVLSLNYMSSSTGGLVSEVVLLVC